MKKKAQADKATSETKRERYEEDLKVISEFTPEEAIQAILSGSGANKK